MNNDQLQANLEKLLGRFGAAERRSFIDTVLQSLPAWESLIAQQVADPARNKEELANTAKLARELQRSLNSPELIPLQQKLWPLVAGMMAGLGNAIERRHVEQVQDGRLFVGLLAEACESLVNAIEPDVKPGKRAKEPWQRVVAAELAFHYHHHLHAQPAAAATGPYANVLIAVCERLGARNVPNLRKLIEGVMRDIRESPRDIAH